MLLIKPFIVPQYNDPEVSSKHIKVRRRRADILKERSNMIVVTKKKRKRTHRKKEVSIMSFNKA